MRYPDFLRKNGTVGFIAPSFGCTTEPYRSRFAAALGNFKDEGYGTVLGPNCYMDCGIGISNTPEKCGLEINDFFLNDKSDVIISCGGGELMCEDLPYVDFDGIAKAAPKWYLGFSDNTNLTFLLNTLCDTASIYGPNASEFGDAPRKKYVSDTLEILTGSRLSLSSYEKWEYVDENDNITEMPYEHKRFIGYDEDIADETGFSGRLIGGCMDCLSNLIGTPFDRVSDFTERYKDDGFIWFIESCDLNVMDIRRCLWHMENAGWFKYVKGFIIGRPLKYYDEFNGFTHIEAARGILGKYGVPIIMDTDLGHISPTMPIISGAVADVTALKNSLRIDYHLKA